MHNMCATDKNSDSEGGSTSESYQAPNGGGGITSKINVNGKKIIFGHGGRHLEGTGLNLENVNNKLAGVVSKLNLKEGQFYKGIVNIDGINIEFTSYGVSDFVTNIGTYYPKP